MKRQKGSVLVLAMVVLVMILFLAGIFLQLTLINIMHIIRESEREKAYWIARAGISQKIHDLREYYFLEQQKVEEKEFAGGKYRVALATLINQGFHKTLAVAEGTYEDTKYSFACEIEMNTPTDYLHFVETTKEPYYLSFLGGPVHVNGDIETGKTWATTGWYKSEDDYGPTVSCSGKFYIKHMVNNDTQFIDRDDYQTAVSEGKFTTCVKGYDSWHYPIHDSYVFHPEEYSLVEGKNLFYISKRGIRKVKKGPLDHLAFPTKVTHIGPDEKEYSYSLIQDKDNGGTYIKVPTNKTLDKKLFKNLISDDWTINFSHPIGTVTYITNECINAYDNTYKRFSSPNVQILGSLQSYFGLAGFDVPFPYERDGDYMKYVMFKYNSEPNYVPLVVGANQNADSFGYNDSTTPPFPGPRYEMYSYTIDRKNKKFQFRYPIVFDNFEFRFAPGLWGAASGKWMGRSLKFSGGTLDYSASGTDYIAYTNGTANQTISPLVPSRYLPIFADPTNKWGHRVVLEIVDTGSPNWSYSYWYEVADLAAAGPNDQVFQVTDYGVPDPNPSTPKPITIRFGGSDIDGDSEIDGKLPPYDSLNPHRYRIRYIWFSHEFSTDLSVWIHNAVKVVKLDLSTINEDNCPRDSKYPDDKNKYGIIYSQVPLVVYGTPRVPVTIFCEDDVYVGPINSDRLVPGDVDNHKNVIKFSCKDDAPNAYPVGIMSKKTIWMDFTYAVSNQPDYINCNTFYDSNKTGGVDVPSAGKSMRINKVVLYSPYFMAPTEDSNNNGMLQIPYIGESVYCRRNSVGNWWPSCGWRVVGSIYKSLDNDFLKVVTDEKKSIPGYCGATFVYASSFRTNPPPHIPMDVRLVSFKIFENADKGSDFITGFKNLIETYGTDVYNREFAMELNKLREKLEE
jgi:hypothetical protein